MAAVRGLADVIKDLRRMNKEQNMFRSESDGFKSNFVINGRVIDATLQNRYNALFLKLEGKLTNKEILTSKHQYIRVTSKSQLGYQSQIEQKVTTGELIEDYNPKTDEDFYVVNEEYIPSSNNKNKSKIDLWGHGTEPNWAYTIHELINGSASTTGAKEILLSVCDGYFLKHPTKTYTE